MSLSAALESWPSVPSEKRGEAHTLYVAEAVSEGTLALLAGRGWSVVDVRLLSGREAVLGKLTGIAAGTIRAPNAGELRALELELRVHKLLSDKAEAPKEDTRALKDDADIDALLSFGRPTVTNVPALLEPSVALPVPASAQARKGRPRGAKDTKPRKAHGEVRGAARKSQLEKQAERGSVDSLAPEAVPKED